jgi:hypothetical protein
MISTQPAAQNEEGRHSPNSRGKPFTRSELIAVAILLLAVFASRAPWLDGGYGIDPDACRVVLAAQHIAETGEYKPSRVPGYPVYEYMAALVVSWGPLASNGMTAVLSCIAVLFFALILRRMAVPLYALVAGALAVIPVVFLNSTVTMDYVPALAFMLASTYFMLAGRSVISGICLGLAIGCRLTSGAMWLPLALWAVMSAGDAQQWRGLIVFSTTTLIVGTLSFAPVFFTFGLDLLTFMDITQYPTWDTIIRISVTDVWGYSGTAVGVAVVVLVVLASFGARQALKDARRRRALLVSGLVVVLYSISFLRLPLNAGYLVPLIPFALLALCLCLPRRLVAPIVGLLILAFLFAPADHGPAFAGVVRRHYAIREARLDETMKIISRVDQIEPKTIVVAAWELPQIRVYLKPEQRGKHIYLYFIKNDEQVLSYLDQGYQIRYLRGLDHYNMEAHGVDLNQYGARPLFEPES